MKMTIESTAFTGGQPIGKKYTEDGNDVSPPSSWGNAPPGTCEFALICEDPDAPTKEPWVHWLVYGIPAGTNQLPEHLPTQAQVAEPVEALQGHNSWTAGRTIGYRGPAPPRGSGKHHYHFRLYALDAPLDLKPGLKKADVVKAMSGHVLAEADLVGTYSR